ncbi:uncharacterized protein I303_102851 [Kwoniella dejecticola CBS 10117]|uniref:Sterol regulatory element-binding protein cleavage-activating protein n=1 Tax=Kwoniella dejecticola CBS 10117 TaxID=1296121 RepID=A0A1A6A9W9_9TREE|nr:uncharacterized protein I303_02867 [Kwoniella dejecticola CBS 10117]OBR86848.1 hypothetical protein I303_02867 [Kwoniella dejecticola CBS 10117]
MSRPGPSPPPSLTPIASTSTAHLASGSGYSNVRHRHDKQPATYPPLERNAPATSRPRRRKRREERKKGRRFRWKRGIVTEAFRQFGEHCARNQIRTLLIDCLVMTNLFYPSMVLWLQKRSPPSFPPAPPPHRYKLPVQGEAGPSTYWQNRPDHPLSLLSTPVLESFFPYPPPLLPPLDWTGWWGSDTGDRGKGDHGWGLSRALPEGAPNHESSEEEIRFVRLAWADVEDILDRDAGTSQRSWEGRDHTLLRLVSDIAEEWEQAHRSTGEGCVRQLQAHDGGHVTPTGNCYIISPNQDLSDSGISQISVSALDSASVFRSESTDYHTATGTSKYRSFGTLFRVPNNSTASFHDRWQRALHGVAGKVEGEIFVEGRDPKNTYIDQTGQWHLSYASRAQLEGEKSPSDSHIQRHPETLSSTPPRFIIFLYVVLLTTLMAQISNASKVHSRFGLAFTGVVQLCCSTVMSFSVLALLGWNGWGASSKQSSLPTYVLPFVIVVVGAENMSTLTKAIFSIPFTYSVPVRIGLGLSKVGTTIALTSSTDLLVLGAVWLCVNLQPVREFCLFAAVVIITDWFMLHTFFLTVLSIDAQRLELADVLASNGGPPVSPVQQAADTDDQGEGKQSGFSWRKLLRARTTKSGSLILLLFICGFLYWLTERHRTSLNTTASLYGYTPTTIPSVTASHDPTPTPFKTTPSDLAALVPAESLWRSLNPLGWRYIKIFISPASILVLPKTGHSMRPADIRKLSLPASRLLLPRLRPLFYLFKVVVLPQAVTAAALYALLLYLLKDADLLDAQRDRLGRVDEQGDVANGNESDSNPTSVINQQARLLERVRASMLPCSHENDVDLIASSSDGQLALSVGIDNSLCLWRFDESTSASGTREITPTGHLDPEDPIVASAISQDKTVVGICAASGVVQIWNVFEDGQIVALKPRKIDLGLLDRVRITSMVFEDYEDPQVVDPFVTTPTLATKTLATKNPVALVAFGNGTVISPREDSDPVVIIEPLQASLSCRSTFIRTSGYLEILFISNEIVRIYRNTPSGWLSTLLTEISEDPITAVSVPEPSLPGLWAVGYRSGSIDLIDETIGHLCSIPPNPSSEVIREVRISRPATMRCTTCNTITSDGYIIVSSTETQIYMDRISPRTPNNPFCKCPSSTSSLRTARASVDGHTRPSNRDFTNGNLVIPPSWIQQRYSPGASPRKSPSTLPLPSNGEFPLSSHGGARRLSNLHKPDDSVLGMTQASLNPNNTMDRSSISGQSSASPAGDFEIHSLGAIVMSPPPNAGVLMIDGNGHGNGNGNWEIVNDHLIGIKRTKEGIDDSQWSVLIVDLCHLWNGHCINLASVQLDGLIQRTRVNHLAERASKGQGMGISISERRKERINSLNGKASFSCMDEGWGGESWDSSTSTSTLTYNRTERKSFSVPTFQHLGYVQVNQFGKFGADSILAGFGNRLGIIRIKESRGDDRRRTANLNADARKSAVGLNRTPVPMMSGNGNGNGNGNGGSMTTTSTGFALGTPTPTTRRSISTPLAPPPPPSANPSRVMGGGNTNNGGVGVGGNKKMD